MKKEKSNFKFTQFKWIFLADSMIIVGAVMSFGAVATYGLGMREENALLMLCMIPPMMLTAALSTYVALRFIRKRMEQLLDGLKAVGNGDMDVCLELKGSDEYKEIYRSFNNMVRELKGTKEEMQAFINEFTHEFKTPITSICGFAQYLADTGQGIESPERMRYLRVIADEALRLSELSQNTLMLTKVEACQIITDKENFNLSEQIKRCSILFLPQMEKKKISIGLDVPEHMQYYGNPELLEQVWINLLNNAVKFTSQNGSIEIRAECRAECIVVSIADDGSGMDEETLAHIFEKYYQGDNSRKRGGNGIGLSIVRRIVTLCGGEIAASATLGAGSTFTISLPIYTR